MPSDAQLPAVFAGVRREAVQLLRSSGRSIPQLAKELGVSPQTLRNSASQRDVDEGKADGLSSAERDELRRLRREVKVLAEEREILKKAAAFFASESRTREGLRVRAREEGRTLDNSDVPRARGQPLGLSRLGEPAAVAAAVEDARLTVRIRELHAKRRKVYGSPRIWVDLIVDDGERIGRERVERLMRQAGLWADHQEVQGHDGSRPGRARRRRSAGPRLPRRCSQPAVGSPTSPTCGPGRAG